MKNFTVIVVTLCLIAVSSPLISQDKESGTIGFNRCLGGLSSTGINCVTVPSHDEFYMTNGTIEAWVYCVNTNGGIIVRKDHQDVSNESYTFGLNNSNHLTFWFTSTSYHYSNSDGTVIPLNQWTHVAVSWVQNSSNNYTLTWFVNGIPSGTSQTVTGVMWIHHSSLAIGNDDTFGGAVFPGYIDEVRFWNRALTAAEMAEKRFTSIGNRGGANTGGCLTGAYAYNGLFTSYTFDYKASNVFEDLSGFNGSYLGSASSLFCLPGLPIPYNQVLCLPNSSTVDNIEVPDNSVLAGTPGTIEAWIYINSSSSNKQTIAGKGLGNSDLSFWFFLEPGTNKLGFTVGTTTVISSGAGVPLNKWTHVAVSYRVPPSPLPRVDFYMNGTLNGTGTISVSMPINTHTVEIGNFVHGFIDELRFWGNKRSEDSLKAYMYASGKSLQGGYLKAVYPFDGNLCNYSPNSGLNGTLRNNTRFSGYLNESVPGAITNSFVAHPTNLNYQLFDSTIRPGVFPRSFFLSAPNMTIPDLSTVYDSIDVSGVPGNVNNAEVFLSIQHLYVGDLQVTVIAPNGTQKMILNRSGGSGKHILTIFKDDFFYVTNGTFGYNPPWSPFVKPDNLMGTFQNSPVSGVWKIKVTDASSGDVGTLIEWGLMLNSTTGVRSISGNVPEKYSLAQNYPNPFNPSTNIKFRVRDTKFVTIKVYDALGKEVKTLVNEKLKPGEYETPFDAGNLPSGVYFCRMQTDNFAEVKKMILLK